MNLYLIGYRCTGKTTIGQRLAEKLDRRFIDADQLLEKRAGMPVAQIVSKFGWGEFRRRETLILQEIEKDVAQVVATGGGIVENADNIRLMRGSGVVIWLRANVETILHRMQEDPETRTLRPALTSLSVSDEIRETLARRTPLYSNASHIVIDTDEASVETITQMLIDQLRSRYAGKFFRPDVSDHHVG